MTSNIKYKKEVLARFCVLKESQHIVQHYLEKFQINRRETNKKINHIINDANEFLEDLDKADAFNFYYRNKTVHKT